LADARRPLDRPGDLRVDGGTAQGTVDFVALPGGRADHLLALVPAGDAAGPAVVRLDGGAATSHPRALLDRTRPLARVRVDGAAAEQVGRLAPADAERLTAEVAVLVAADALGAAQWLLDATVAYVRDRHQFGVPVGSFQAVKHAAAQMLVPIEATRAAVGYAAWALDAGEDDALEHAWIAKAYAADHLPSVADKALFLHGAIGYTWEHDLQLPFKRIKADALLAGGAAGYHDRVAALVGLAPSA
ncbi:acyl-CoA dehydrogenase family protein, partial [Patulibacter sp. S7RM1-6]